MNITLIITINVTSQLTLFIISFITGSQLGLDNNSGIVFYHLGTTAIQLTNYVNVRELYDKLVDFAYSQSNRLDKHV